MVLVTKIGIRHETVWMQVSKRVTWVALLRGERDTFVRYLAGLDDDPYVDDM